MVTGFSNQTRRIMRMSSKKQREWFDAAFRLARPFVALSVILAQLSKLHLPLRNDQAISSVLIINLVALPIAADCIQLTSIRLQSNSGVMPLCDEPLLQHCSVLNIKLQVTFEEQSGKRQASIKAT